MGTQTRYKAPVAIPPGDTIKELLRVSHFSAKTLAERMGLSNADMVGLVWGILPLTEDWATLLALHLGGDKDLWLNLEKNYRETKERLEIERGSKK